MNSSRNTPRQGVAFGLASIVVAGGTLVLSSAAVADQAVGDSGSTTSTSTYSPAVPDIDERVALRKNALYRAWARGR